MTPVEYQQWLDETVTRLALEDAVIGVVAMGSTANRSRTDEWSDHDIAIVVAEGSEAQFRGDVSWMANHESVVDVVTEHHGGCRALFADGHLVEWGVASLQDFATWYASDCAVLLDRGGVSDVVAQIAVKPFPPSEGSFERDLSLFFMTILHGCGRLRRGETISANAIIRGAAVEHLVRAARATVPSRSLDGDRLDSLRRVENAMPDFAAQLAECLVGDLEGTALALVDLVEACWAGADNRFPAATLKVVRDRLGWTESAG